MIVVRAQAELVDVGATSVDTLVDDRPTWPFSRPAWPVLSQMGGRLALNRRNSTGVRGQIRSELGQREANST